MRKDKKWTGFTLVELLVAMTIFTILSAVIVAAYIGAQRSFVTGAALLDLQSQTRQSINWLRRDIKWAILIDSSHGSYTTSDNELILVLPSIDTAHNLTGTVDYVTYHLNSSDPAILERIVESNATSTGRPSGTFTIARDVNSLNFSSGGTGLSGIGMLQSVREITVNLNTARTVLGGRQVQSNVETTILMRNNL